MKYHTDRICPYASVNKPMISCCNLKICILHPDRNCCNLHVSAGVYPAYSLVVTTAASNIPTHIQNVKLMFTTTPNTLAITGDNHATHTVVIPLI